MYLLFLARRYLLARWVMSGAMIIIIMVAVFTLIAVRAVFQGFGDQMRDMVRGTTSDLVVTTVRPMDLPYAEEIAAEITRLPRVTGTAPYVETMAMFQVQSLAGPYTDYLQIKGIDPVREAKIGKFAHYLLRPDDAKRAINDPDKPLPRPEERAPLAADEIAWMFGAEHRDEVWNAHKEYYRKYAPDKVALWEKKLPPPVVVGVQALSGNGRIMELGSIIQLTTYSPRRGEIKTGEFLVVGAFHTGLFQNDRQSLYMPLGAACEFVDLYDPDLPDEENFPAGGWRVSGVEVALEDYERDKLPTAAAIEEQIMPRYRARLESGPSRLGILGAYTASWERHKHNLLRAVDVEKGIVTLIIGILFVFVVVIIFLILTLNVIEKRRDIGILKAVGSLRNHIFAIFVIHGGTICVLGMALGFVSGMLFCTHINAIHDTITQWTGWRLFPPDIYYMDRIPVAIKLSDLLMISGFTVLCGFAGSLIPAYSAARQDPIAAIHSE